MNSVLPAAADITAHIQAGRLTEAEKMSRRLCEQRPADASAWQLQAAVHAMKGQWDEVARCCREIIALNPANVEARQNLAAAFANLGQFAQASDVYQQVLQRQPDDADAWLGLAACHQRQERPHDALPVLEEALRHASHDPRLQVARGDARLALDDAAGAEDSYRRALQLDAGNVAARYGLGRACQDLGRTAEARQHFETVTALNPGFADAHGRLGWIQAQLGQWSDAARSFEQVLALDPAHVSALVNYGSALKALGRLSEAAEIYRRAVALDPSSEAARYFAAAFGDGTVPAQSPPGYVRDLFDGTAGRFDEHLVATLRYRVPEVIGDTLRELLGANARLPRVLDLGCGTGLVGRAVRGIAGHLTGVDLSAKMLKVAREKGDYDELRCAEIGEFLAARRGAYDTILAADVFIYIGDFGHVLASIAAALSPGGLCVFSVERHDGEESYVLRPSGRYAQSHAFVRSAARASGLEEIRADELAVRLEGGAPIAGTLFVLRAGGRA